MAELDTSPAPWLQRAWSPRETFDPTPWLQERYRRQVEQAKLPLQLQGMALQNQAAQLQIEHQGIQNDLANEDLNAYRRDLPRIKDFGDMTKGDPLKMLETPPPQLESIQGQQILSNQIRQASQVGFAQRHQALETAKIAIATKAYEMGQDIPMSTDPVTGKPTFAPKDIEEAFNQGMLKSLIGKALLAQQKLPPSQVNIAALDAAKASLAEAQRSGDAGRIAAAQQHLESVMSYAPGQQIIVNDPATGKPILQMGRQQPGDLTNAVRSEEEKHIINSEQAVGDLLSARDQLNNPNVLGIWPTAANTIFDKIMGNISPSFVNEQRVKGRSAVNWTKQDFINQMRQRYGEHAVARMESMLPSTGLLENPQNARILTDALITAEAADAANRSEAIGRPPSEHVLRALSRMSNSELDKEIGYGRISPKIALGAVKVRSLPPGQMPPGFEPVSAGHPVTIAPAAPTSPSTPARITWDDLFRLYKSGKLSTINASTSPDTEEE